MRIGKITVGALDEWSLNSGLVTSWHPTAAAVEKARLASGSKTVRVIRPGMAVTMDYRIDRLNVDLNDKDVVTRVHCG